MAGLRTPVFAAVAAVVTLAASGNTAQAADPLTYDATIDSGPNIGVVIGRPSNTVFTFAGAPTPGGDGVLTVDGYGDINSILETISVYAETSSGTYLGELFDLPSDPQTEPIRHVDTITIPRALMEQFASDGSVSIALVNPSDGEAAYIQYYSVNLSYPLPSPTVLSMLVAGPLKDDGGGNLVPFDVNNDAVTDAADEGNLIGVGLSHAQYFAYEIGIENNAPDNALDGLAFLDVLPDGFRLSADAEDALASCAGPACDGVVEDASGDCIVTVSGPKAKKNTFVPRYVTIETDGLAASATCTTTLYVETAGGGSGKGKKATTFEPTACEIAETDGVSQLTNTIALNDGVKVFDAATNDLLLGPVGSIQLAPQGCP